MVCPIIGGAQRCGRELCSLARLFACLRAQIVILVDLSLARFWYMYMRALALSECDLAVRIMPSVL